jgi:hypothetical protein
MKKPLRISITKITYHTHRDEFNIIYNGSKTGVLLHLSKIKGINYSLHYRYYGWLYSMDPNSTMINPLSDWKNA